VKFTGMGRVFHRHRPRFSPVNITEFPRVHMIINIGPPACNYVYVPAFSQDDAEACAIYTNCLASRSCIRSDAVCEHPASCD
jgi:hypothetical protein